MVDTLNDVHFTVLDAEKLVNESKRRTEAVNLRLHTQVVKRIRQRAERRLRSLTYTLPLTLFGFPHYNPRTVLRWLFHKLENDGFKVKYNLARRQLMIEWPIVTTTAKRRTAAARKKSVRFSDDNNLFQYYHKTNG